MRVLVLGGLGIQGRAAISDLSRSEAVREVVCADSRLDGWPLLADHVNRDKVSLTTVDGSSREAIASALCQGVDVAIDLLPFPLMPAALEAAIETRVPIVSTNYGHTLRHLHERAVEAGVTLLPECGLDPGIDLVICGHAVRQFDALHVLNSYCGGIPEPSACDNPLNYKISWNWDMVLRSQKRESVFIREGKTVTVPPADQHDCPMIHQIPFPGLGQLEAVPNGNARFYAELLGVEKDIRESGRYSLRYPGWCAFWNTIKQLGFLSDEPVAGLDPAVTPHQFMVKLLEPQLQYKANEKDLAVMVNEFIGVSQGRRKRIVNTLLIERDLESGFLAMSLGVGYTASIAAQMIGSGQITKKGMLNPAIDVPYEPFMAELARRGIKVQEEVFEEEL